MLACVCVSERAPTSKPTHPTTEIGQQSSRSNKTKPHCPPKIQEPPRHRPLAAHTKTPNRSIMSCLAARRRRRCGRGGRRQTQPIPHAPAWAAAAAGMSIPRLNPPTPGRLTHSTPPSTTKIGAFASSVRGPIDRRTQPRPCPAVPCCDSCVLIPIGDAARTPPNESDSSPRQAGQPATAAAAATTSSETRAAGSSGQQRWSVHRLIG